MPDPKPATGFIPFSLPIKESSKCCTGIACLPNPAGATDVPTHYAKPLLVGLHGGGCTSAYFDLTPETSAASISLLTGIPFISIDRPGYGPSAFHGAVEEGEGEDFWEKSSRMLHSQILPLIWESFGASHGCSAIVLVAHSFGGPPAIMTAALHARDESIRTYPLSGLILSGYGVLPESGNPMRNVPTRLDRGSSARVEYSFETSKLLMLAGDEPRQYYSASALQSLKDRPDRQIVPVPVMEVQSARRWTQTVSSHAGNVKVPVWNIMAQGDWLIDSSIHAMRRFEALFTNAPLVDSSIVRGAPHAIEWSNVAYGYYLRCFGWASEVVNVVE